MTQPVMSQGAARGVMTKTSATTIDVNGTRYDVGTASVRVGDAPSSPSALKDGMVVRVKGMHDGNRGSASHVEAENEIRGTVTQVDVAANPPYFMVGAVKVIVTPETVYDDLAPPSLAAIVVGLPVEVYGERDSTGSVIASRVEGKSWRDPSSLERDEIRGRITAVGGEGALSQFSIGNITVTYDTQTTFKPAPACSASALAVGVEVEAHGRFASDTTLEASRIECEQIEDHDRNPHGGDDYEVEGYVSDLNIATSTFEIDGQLVSYSSATRFKDGTVADLANNVKVEVEGRMQEDGTLVAHVIEFKHTRIKLSGVPSAVAGNSLTLFGKAIMVDDLTAVRARNEAGSYTSSLADVVANRDRVEVRARLVGGALLAEKVTEKANTDDYDEVQARVVTENDAAMTLGLLDPAAPISVTLTTSTVYEMEDRGRIDASQFFAAVVPAGTDQTGTLVKVKGRYAGGVLTATEAEVED